MMVAYVCMYMLVWMYVYMCVCVVYVGACVWCMNVCIHKCVYGGVCGVWMYVFICVYMSTGECMCGLCIVSESEWLLILMSSYSFVLCPACLCLVMSLWLVFLALLTGIDLKSRGDVIVNTSVLPGHVVKCFSAWWFRFLVGSFSPISPQFMRLTCAENHLHWTDVYGRRT